MKTLRPYCPRSKVSQGCIKGGREEFLFFLLQWGVITAIKNMLILKLYSEVWKQGEAGAVDCRTGFQTLAVATVEKWS